MTFCCITLLRLVLTLELMKSRSCWKRLMSAKTTPRHVASTCQQSCRRSTVIENRVHMQEEEVCVKKVGKSHGKCNCTIFSPVVNEDLRWLCCRRTMFVCFPRTQWQYGHGNSLWSYVQNQLTVTIVWARWARMLCRECTFSSISRSFLDHYREPRIPSHL